MDILENGKKIAINVCAITYDGIDLLKASSEITGKDWTETLVGYTTIGKKIEEQQIGEAEKVIEGENDLIV